MRRRSSRRWSPRVGGESAERPIALTIGTAGHVDHGKTTLVRYMTGTDTDRLEEEHRRGISIVPGYAELELPSGRRASLVDVPGHERFVKNMVAGATGVDAFLLVVAADDGVMPQTRELLESVGFDAPIIRVSGTTGEGVDELLLALDELAGASRDGRSGSYPPLPVDRAFVLTGIGLVATGTLWSGEIRPGDTLYTTAGHRPRVRGIQNHGRPAEAARAGARTALDLAGIETAELEPGDVLLSSPVPVTRALDARLELLESASPLKHGTRLRLYHGTRATNVRVRILDREELMPGGNALARLILREELVVLPGDRFVLRSSSPQVTVGGGTILDPAPAKRRPEKGWLEALESRDWARVVPLALARAPQKGTTAEELSLVVPAAPVEVAAAVEGKPEVAKLGGLYAPAGEVEAARDRLFKALEKRAEERPESPRLSVAEARTATGLDARLADALLAALTGDAKILTTETGVSSPNAEAVPPELEEEASELLETLRRAGTEPPSTQITPAARLLLKRGQIARLADGPCASKEAGGKVFEE